MKIVLIKEEEANVFPCPHLSSLECVISPTVSKWHGGDRLLPCGSEVHGCPVKVAVRPPHAWLRSAEKGPGVTINYMLCLALCLPELFKKTH